MYYPKIRKTQAQLEMMISALVMEYGAKTDSQLAILMAKYFEVNKEDVVSSLMAYRGYKEEDYEQLSNKQFCYGQL